jgi:hypothetical protein
MQGEMNMNLATVTSSAHDLQSWNHNILSFDLDGLEAASADRASLDQRIKASLASFFGELTPVGYEPCDQFHCSPYG